MENVSEETAANSGSEHTKNLTETVQTLITGLNSHGSHNTIDPASHLTEIKKKTNRTKPSKYHTDYLDRESGCVWPSSSATNNLQLFTSTQDASQQSKPRLPPLQRQNAPHNGHSPRVDQQQPAAARSIPVHSRSRSRRNERPFQPKHQNKKKTNRTMLSKYHPNYLAGEPGRIRPSSSAINNLQLFTSTQDASQHSQSQSPPLQRQNAPHNGHSLSVGSQQPATARPPRRLRQERPSQTRNQNRHPLPQDTYFYRTPYIFKS